MSLVPADPSADLLHPANFATRFSPAAPDNAAVRELRELLVRLNEQADTQALAEWLEDASAWLRHWGAVPGRKPDETRASARLRLALTALAELPEKKASLQRAVARVLEEGSGVALFTDTGVPSHTAFFTEALERFQRGLLPEPPVHNHLSRLLYRVFPSQRAVRWFEALSPDERKGLLEALGVQGEQLLLRLRPSMVEASRILATRVAALGVDDEVRERAKLGALKTSPFLNLAAAIEAAVADDSAAKPHEAARGVIAQCRSAAREVVSSLDATGVSVELVYRLELIRRMLDRLYVLLNLLAPGGAVAGASARFALALMHGGLRDRSLGDHFRTNSRILALRVIERAGFSGENYITRTRAEQHQMISMAAGGGAVTGFLVLTKFLLGWAGLPPLIDGLLVGLNYGLGFVLMQFLHFTLATKQPAMTAATLAAAVPEQDRLEPPDLEPLVEQVARTSRSQLAALVGNLGVVIPVAVLIDLSLRLGLGRGLLSVEYAERVIAAHHPLFSATVLFAMFTGVMLWLSSLIAGMVENWWAVHHLPEALRTNRVLRRLLGPERAARLAEFTFRNISALAGNLSLGLLLGLVPFLIRLVGIPFEVRHVTFVTGQLVFAGMARGAEGVLEADYVWALAAALLVGFLNFAVSFFLALLVALRARGQGLRAQAQLGRAVLRRLWKTPLDFVRAPLEAATPRQP